MTTIPKFSPIIPVRRSAVFHSGEWVYELKYDGFRALGYLDKGWCRLVSRNGNQFKRFDELSRSIGKEIKARNAVP